MRTHAAFVIVSDSARAVHPPYCVHHEAPCSCPRSHPRTGHGSFSATTRGTSANRTQHTLFVRDSLTSTCPCCHEARCYRSHSTDNGCLQYLSIIASMLVEFAPMPQHACQCFLRRQAARTASFASQEPEKHQYLSCEKPHFSSFSPSLAQSSLHQSGVTETLRKWPCQRQHVWRSTGCSS